MNGRVLAAKVPSQRPRPRLRVVDHLRVSRDDQAKGFGIAYTGRKAKRYIERKGWEHVATFTDEGVSGALPWEKRDGMRRLMRRARQEPRPFDAVVVVEPRAVGRQDGVFWRWVWELHALGIATGIVDKDIDNTTERGEATMRREAQYAFAEYVRTRKRTQGGIQEKAEGGGHPGGQAPWGWRIEDRGHTRMSRLVVDDTEAACARRARELFTNCGNWRTTAARLNDEGFRNRDGGLWTHNNLRGRMLSETLLTARRVWRGGAAALENDGQPLHGPRVTQSLPPIFTSDEVAELRVATEKRGLAPRTGTRSYPLSKRLLSPCGEWYVGQNFRDSPALYRCRAREESRPGARDGCSCPSVQAEATEAAVWRGVCGELQLVGHPASVFEDRLPDQAARAQAAGRRVAELEERVSEQTDVVALTTSSLARAARSRGMTAERARHFIERAVRPLNDELAGLEELLHEAREWGRQVQGRRAQVGELRRLIDTARGRQEALTDEERARLVKLLDVRATVLKAPPPNKGGTPCAVAQWFADRGREVPQPTIDGWRRLAAHLPVLCQESV